MVWPLKTNLCVFSFLCCNHALVQPNLRTCVCELSSRAENVRSTHEKFTKSSLPSPQKQAHSAIDSCLVFAQLKLKKKKKPFWQFDSFLV